MPAVSAARRRVRQLGPSRPMGGLLAATVAATGVTGVSSATALTADRGSAPSVPIKHVIEIMIENHSFDNLFGQFHGADGIPAGTTLLNPQAYYVSAPE